MASIRIDLGSEPMDGQHVTFKAPSDCTAVTGIRVYYPNGDEKVSRSFTMKDAHGNELAGIGNLFLTGAYVHVILDTVNGFAYLQNSDTNGYLETKFRSHTQAASTITAGTLAGKVVANASAVSSDANGQLRNIGYQVSDMTAGTTSLSTGTIWLIRE